MNDWENPNWGTGAIPPPPISDPVPGATAVPPPPPDAPRPTRSGSRVGGGCLSSLGVVVSLLSLMLFSAAGDARASSDVFMSGLGDFLYGVAQLMLVIGIVLLAVGLGILGRSRR